MKRREITQEDIDLMAEIVRKDFEMSPEDWSKQDIDDMRACGFRVPRNAGKNRRQNHD